MSAPAPFIHRHSGHCESGTVAALLRNHGLDLSEPMVFGIGGGLFFLYMPFITMGGIPLISYRDAPRTIMKNVCKRLGVRMRYERFRDPDAGMAALDRRLAQGVPVGMQTSVFWLPYFPADMRFQFNGHNLVAFDKRDGEYFLSDPVFEHTVRCPADALRRARFAKGIFAPKGLIYWPEFIPRDPDIKAAARAAIAATARRMLNIPFPFLGVRGIRTLARQLPRWPRTLGAERARKYVGSVVRMQEEIGTGGAGFRFMYAAFLQEAGELLGSDVLRGSARELTAVGDRWRDFAVQGAQLVKSRADDPQIYGRLSGVLSECAEREEQIFTRLKSMA